MNDYGGIEHAGAAFELARELELQRARASRRGGARWVRAGATLSLLALSAVVAFRRLATPLSEAVAARQNNLGATAADASLLAPLSFSARSDGYEPLADHTIEMYSRFSHIVEPHKRTYLAADGASTSDHSGFAWHVARLAHGGAVATPDEELMAERESGASVAEDEDMVLLAGTGTETSVVFTDVNRKYRIRLTEELRTGTRRLVESTTVVCKYVRREIRDLSDEDRNRYFAALEIVYSTSLDDGIALYGAHYKDYKYFTILHNTNVYCYHHNLAFLTTHPAFTLELDRSLQTIDAMVTQPYWDFMLDADLGPKWFDSPVYQEDWYGTVDNPESDHGRVRGRFRNVTTIYDGDNEYPNAHHNPYGFITGEYDLTNTGVLTRTNHFCGYKNTQPFPACGNMRGCFENYTTLAMFDRCMEDTVHANLHGLHGGQLACLVSLEERFSSMPYLSEDLKNFVTATISDVTGKWKSFFKYLACPRDCKQNEPMSTCKCTNTLGLEHVDDIDKLDDTDVYEYLYDALYYLASDSYMGQRFMWRNPKDDKIAWIGLTADQNHELNRAYLAVLAFPGVYGQMATGAAPNDPIFWPIHPLFEKAWQVIRMSPKFASEDVAWKNHASSECNGTDFDARTPFKSLFDNNEERYTNEQLWHLFKPDGDDIPYVYDQFVSWGGCEWDPLKSAHSSVSTARETSEPSATAPAAVGAPVSESTPTAEPEQSPVSESTPTTGSEEFPVPESTPTTGSGESPVSESTATAASGELQTPPLDARIRR